MAQSADIQVFINHSDFIGVVKLNRKDADWIMGWAPLFRPLHSRIHPDESREVDWKGNKQAIQFADSITKKIRAAPIPSHRGKSLQFLRLRAG
jgi:hypothetical protein